MFGIFFILGGLADIVTLIPFVGAIVSPVYFVIFGFYLWKSGHGLVNWKNLVSGGISVAGEMLPFIQAFPTITLATAVIFGISRTEDKTGLSLTPHKKHGVTPPRSPREPANKDGVRPPRKGNIVDADFSTQKEDIDMSA